MEDGAIGLDAGEGDLGRCGDVEPEELDEIVLLDDHHQPRAVDKPGSRQRSGRDLGSTRQAHQSSAAQVARAVKDGAEERASSGSIPAARTGQWAMSSGEGI